MSCDDLKFLYTECVKNIQSQEYSPKIVKECFETWEKLIKCVNTDIQIPIPKTSHYERIERTSIFTKEDLLYEK